MTSANVFSRRGTTALNPFIAEPLATLAYPFEVGEANSSAMIASIRSFTHSLVGASPSSSACADWLSAVARFITFTAHCGGTENAKQMMRASHSSKSFFCSGSLVWCTLAAVSPGTNLARRRRARSPENSVSQ